MAAAKSMDRNGSQLIRDFMRQTVERQHNTWFRDQVAAGRQQLECGDVLSHAGQPGQDKVSINTLTRYAHACNIKKLYHWYNGV